MRLLLVLAATVSMAVTVIVLLSSSFDSKVNAITNVNNTYFSMDIPDDWRYAEHLNTGMAGMAESPSRGPVNLVALAPADFAESLVVNKDQESPYAKMLNGGAYSTFRQDADYTNKNSTLEEYVKHRINSLIRGVNLTSQQDTIVGNEKAVRIEGNGIKILKNLKYVAYLVLHDKDPYYLEYIANVNDFQKYLPQFEQMVKTLKFVK
jgi:hypothetical protein